MSEARDDYWDEWMRTVRDPADAASEGKRTLTSGDAEASYDVSPLPDGRWAVRCKCVGVGGTSGMSAPWRAFPTREEAVAYFVEITRQFFGEAMAVKGVRDKARRQMLKLLDGQTLFGWPEPPLDAE